MKKLFVILTAIVFVCLLAVSVSAEAVSCSEHKFESAVITKAPTHTEDGVLTYTCSACGMTETKVIEARHTYHSVVTTKATCTQKGLLTHTCECGQDSYTEETDYVHAYHETVTVDPNCATGSAGTVVKVCSLCGDRQEESLPASHTPINMTVLYAPSCFFEGSVRYDCSVCGLTDITSSIDKSHKFETEISKEATCTEDGILRHTCMYCNTSHTDIIEAKHTYSITGDPTDIIYHDFTQTGIKYYKCSNCDANEGLIANPLFTFLGYSTSTPTYTEGALVDICCGYSVNYEELELLQRVWGANGKTFEFGFVGAYEHCLSENQAPLDSATAEPAVTSDPTNFSVKKLKFPNKPYSTVDGQLVNISYDDHTTYFYVCLYIYDGAKTVYISDDSCRELPLPISYSMLVDGGDHDDVGTNNIAFGDISYSTIEGTKPSQARLDLIAASTSDYKSEESTDASKNDEDTIASIGSIGSWAGTVPNANELLNYYLELGGEATHYHDLDISALLDGSSEAKDSWLSSINNILRAGELMAIEGETVNIDQTTESEVQLSTSSWLWNDKRDWYLTFVDGFYYTDTDLDNLTVTYVRQNRGDYNLVDGKYVKVDAGTGNYVRQYTANIVYTVIDYYTFYPYKDETNSEQFLLWGPTKQELAQLHLDGNALDFLIESSINYTVTWTDGQRVGTDDMFNKYTDIITVTETVDSSIIEEVTNN